MHVIIMRGLPGSGKSTRVSEILTNFSVYPSVVVSADDFFMNNGVYQYDPTKIAEAHDSCKSKYVQALIDKTSLIIVDNTHVRLWEMQFYRNVACMFNASKEVISLFDGGLTDLQLFERNLHNVPLQTITRMRNSYEH